MGKLSQGSYTAGKGEPGLELCHWPLQHTSSHQPLQPLPGLFAAYTIVKGLPGLTLREAESFRGLKWVGEVLSTQPATPPPTPLSQSQATA